MQAFAHVLQLQTQGIEHLWIAVHIYPLNSFVARRPLLHRTDTGVAHWARAVVVNGRLARDVSGFTGI